MIKSNQHVERFAPSPTGLLHLGHAYSAWCAWQAARSAQGTFLLRMEDLDTARVRTEHYDSICEDLAWLGLEWPGPVIRQSERGAAYGAALQVLASEGLVYSCACSRRDIQEASAAPQEGVSPGPDGPVYPGTCRLLELEHARQHALRLDMAKAVAAIRANGRDDDFGFLELGAGPAGETGRISINPDSLVNDIGDIVLRRRDGAIAYHLAVVVDDAFQDVTHVTRGQDLFSATPIHRVLQSLLRVPVPSYRHHGLVRDDSGKRLAKRDDARAIAAYRADGMSPADVLALARSSVRALH